MGDALQAEPQTATFLVADLAGYTALTEAHGDAAAADVAARFTAEVRGVLADYEAEDFKTVGDAVIVRVADAGSAVHLAARILGEFAQRDRSLSIRVGLHTGTAVARDGEWFGSAVNVASRIADLAHAGEAVMSAATRTAAGGELAGAQVRPRGRRRLKNVRDPVELFLLAPEESDGARRLPVDPVCRMSVDPDLSDATEVYRGVAYHFCSASCAEAFRRSPAQYVESGRSSSRALVLVSDDARDRAARWLARAYGEGRIDAGELEQRVEAVWSARTRADLKAITGDLPRARPRPIPPLLMPIAPLVFLTRLIRARWRRRRARRRGRY